MESYLYFWAKLSLLFFIILLPCLELDAESYDFRLLDGRSYTYQDLSSYSKVVFMFWASWCYYCREKLEEINRYSSQYGETQIFFINLGETKSVVTKFVNQERLKPFIKDNIVLDKNSVLAKKFGIIGIPFFVFLKKGEVVYRGYEFNDGFLKKLFKDE